MDIFRLADRVEILLAMHSVHGWRGKEAEELTLQ